MKATKTEELVWTAQERQREFLRAKEDEVLYGGAAGGGKTDALLIDLIRTCVRHPGAQCGFLRKTFADLSKPKAAIPRSLELLTGVATWNGQDHKWTFPNGSVLQFGHVQHATDIYSYQGSQFDRLAFDEVTHFTFEEYNYLRSRVRATVPNIRTGIRAAGNPGGIGHAWVKGRFIEAAAPGTSFALTEGGRTVSLRYIPAKVWDNTALLERDPEYPARLATLGETLSRALLEGDWDIFAGQVFTEWRRASHVCKPFSIPAAWPRWRALDWGFAAPFCFLWGTRAPSGQIYVYREVYGPKVQTLDQALKVKLLSAGETFRATVADTYPFGQQRDGRPVKSIASEYAEMGVPLTLANTDRLAGKQRVHELLAWTEHPEKDGEVLSPPGLQVFDTCTNLIRTLPSLVYDPNRVEDVDTESEDHAYDCLRYLLMAMSAERPHQPRQTYATGRR